LPPRLPQLLSYFLRQPAAWRIDPKFLAIAAVAAVLILYGSLYPFRFSSRPGSPLQALLSTWRERTARSDVLANLMLYFPLGFFAAHGFSRAPQARHVLAIAAAAGSLSFIVEILQFYDQSRVSSLTDVYANTAGGFLGAVTAGFFGRHSRALPHAPQRQHYFVILLLGCWLAYRLFPFVPTIDISQYRAALRPLLRAPHLSLQALYRHFATALAAAALLDAWFGAARSRFIAPAVLLAVLCGRIAITGLSLSRAEVLGYFAAAALWTGLLSHLRWRMPLVAALFAAMIAVDALEPFRFLAHPRPFGWVPFRGFLRGSLTVDILSFFEKVFYYGALPWLLHRSGWGLSLAAAAAAVFVTILRFCQCYLPGRSAEITDALMVLLLAGLMALLSQPRRALT
jgi:VanZ family protein